MATRRGNDQGPRVLPCRSPAMLQLLDGQIERPWLVRNSPISGLLPGQHRQHRPWHLRRCLVRDWRVLHSMRLGLPLRTAASTEPAKRCLSWSSGS